MENEKVEPFDSFALVYKLLILTGFYKLSKRPKSKLKWICFKIYRFISVNMVIGFSIAHFIFIIQRRDNLDDVFDSSVVLIPMVNLLVKLITLNWNMRRIDKINDLIRGPMFAAYTKNDEELLIESKRNMHRLMHSMNVGISLTGIFWTVSHFFRRFQDPTATTTAYVPFEVHTWARFSLAVFMEMTPVFWVGNGHLALDCVMATYYAQGEVQLKIIKYNLEHLFDTDGASAHNRCYIDVADNNLKNRFVHYVKRYEAVIWYINEIGDIFNIAMALQFLISTSSLCVVTYRMSSIPVASVQFIFLALLLFILMCEVFMYCYYGNLVKYESELLTTSVYLSNWLSVSPQFRRTLLISMMFWSRTLTPHVSGIIPLSLNTFVSILKGAYSLYAVLVTNQ